MQQRRAQIQAVPAGSQAGFSVMLGKYFTMPLNIIPNLLLVAAVTEESGALPSFWTAHHENRRSQIMHWVEFPSLVLLLKENRSKSLCVFAIQRVFFLPSSPLSKAYLRPGSETGNLPQPMRHHRCTGYHSALPCAGAAGSWKGPSSSFAHAASPEPGAHNWITAIEFLRQSLNKPEFQRRLEL